MFTQVLITVISIISVLHAGDLAMVKTDTALLLGGLQSSGELGSKQARHATLGEDFRSDLLEAALTRSWVPSGLPGVGVGAEGSSWLCPLL